MSHKSLFSASLFLGFSSLLSRGLGVWRDHLFATMFGVAGQGIYSLDTYYAAFRIPDMLYSLLVYGTISVAFMPIFSEHLAGKRMAEAWKFASNVMNLLLLIFGVIALVIFIFAEPLMQIFVYGFSPEKIQQTAALVRIMLLSPLFFTVAAIAIGVENSFQRFTAQALAPIIYNLGIICGALFWGKNFGVYGLVLGVVLGACGYMLIQLPPLFHVGFRWMPIFSFKQKDTREMFRLVIPRIISLSAMQVNLIVDTFIGSGLIVGSLTALNLAQNLQSLPFGLISVSVAITSFSLFTKFAAEKDWEQFKVKLKKAARMTFYLLFPAVAGMFLLRTEIVRLVLQGGNFQADAAEMTTNLLALLLLALIAQGLIPILVRAFFALKNTYLPLYISLAGMVANAIGSIVFSHFWGVNGLALANAVGMWINFVLLYFFLARQFPRILPLKFLAKVSGATILMGGAIALVQSVWQLQSANVYTEISYLIFLTASGLLIYLAASAFLNPAETKILFKNFGFKRG